MRTTSLIIIEKFIKQWSQPLLRWVILLILLTGFGINTAQTQSEPENVVFILSDDHRYDYMNFHPESPDFLKTPGMDRMAEEGLI